MFILILKNYWATRLDVGLLQLRKTLPQLNWAQNRKEGIAAYDSTMKIYEQHRG